MATLLMQVTLALALTAPGGIHPKSKGGRILPPGPGYGWGFPNGARDGYGWYNTAGYLPLSADRTPEYYFPRYMAAQPAQLFLPTYYNSYVSRGQRYVPYVGCGGWHPAGGAPTGSSRLPRNPAQDEAEGRPEFPFPRYSGHVQAAPINPGRSGLTP